MGRQMCSNTGGIIYGEDHPFPPPVFSPSTDLSTAVKIDFSILMFKIV